MPVDIEEDSEGKLKVIFEDEPGLAESPGFRSVLLAFVVVGRNRNNLILDVGDRLADATEFLREQLGLLGFEVNLSGSLQRYLDDHQHEIQTISNITDRAASNNLLSSIPAEPPLIGFRESATLLPHQIRGLRHALAVENLAEFSVQGAGKTAIAIAAFAMWKSQGHLEKAMVVGPASCFAPWESELIRCLGPDMQSIRWSGAAGERRRLVPAFRTADLILCTYDTAIRDIEMIGNLLKQFPTLLILDESHYIKNFQVGSRATAMFKIAPLAARRMILTGTPAPHSLYDLWTQFSFLWPGGGRELMGTRQQFQDLIESTRFPVAAVRQKLAPFFHRTSQAELGLPQPVTDFPTISRSSVPAEQSRIINLLEIRILAEARRRLLDLQDQEVLREWQKARVIRLLQAASNPGLLLAKGNWSPAVGDVDMSELMEDALKFQRGDLLSAKVQWTVDKAQELVSEGKKVVIWTWWVDNLKLLNNLLADLHPLLLFGEIKPYIEDSDDPEEPSRERNINEFRNRNDRPLLLANPSACAEAISLHRECHDAIYLDRTFNCGQFLQSLNRIHRVGLPEEVTTHYWVPILNCAVERSVNTRLERRQQVMYEFLDDRTPVIGYESFSEIEAGIADDLNEIQEAFKILTREIEVGNQLSTSVEPT